MLYRLHMRGMLAALTPRNAPTADILVFSDEETVSAAIQVKTRTYGRDGGWHLNMKHETIQRPRLFYAFVDMEPATPVTYVVPSRVVADVVTKSHRAWLAIPGLKGQPHKDNAIRRIQPSYGFDVPGYPEGWLEAYKERWDLLTPDGGPTELDRPQEPAA